MCLIRGRPEGATILILLPGAEGDAEDQRSLRRDGFRPPTVLPLCIPRSNPRSIDVAFFRERYMRLADARGPQQHDVLAVLDEVAAGERLQLLAIDRGLVAEVERIEALHEREARQAGAHG